MFPATHLLFCPVNQASREHLAQPRRRSERVAAATVFATVTVVVCLTFGGSGSTLATRPVLLSIGGDSIPASSFSRPTPPAMADPAQDVTDDSLRERLLGTWTTRKFGRQRLTHHADGTATLDIEPNRLAALRYGRRMQLELEWSIEAGVVQHRIVDGVPQRSVARLIESYGDTFEYAVLEASGSHLLVSEPDEGGSVCRWDAVDAATSP